MTGASRGIGLEVVRQLARLGMTVILGARDPEKGEAAAAGLAGEGLRAPARRPAAAVVNVTGVYTVQSFGAGGSIFYSRRRKV